jgi:hypothetical protein
LTYQASLPEQPGVKRRPVLFKGGIEFRQHTECKCTIGCDILMAANNPCSVAAIGGSQ